MRRSSIIGSWSLSLLLPAAWSSAMTACAPREPSPTAAIDDGDVSNAPAVTEWLSAHGSAVRTVEAENGFDDLEPLRRMVGDARIVALGEPTHGTREVFQMKHRLLEFLVERMGFSIFAIEANQPECEPLNDYVLGRDDGSRSVEELIHGMYFWTWSTEEVREMVQWMRRFNAGNAAKDDARRIQFTGFDMQTHSVALANVRRFAQAQAPELIESIDAVSTALDASGKARMRRGRSEGFGVATATFPVDQARGKTVKLSGWIKTQGLTNGWAGLWWRNDGPAQEMLGFDNMQNRGLRGTTEWTRLELTLPVPDRTVNINFGVLMPGEGKAWFDDLRIELDGVEHPVDPAFDLAFDGAEIVGFVTGTTTGRDRQRWPYTASIDTDIKHGGAGSLRIESSEDAATKAAQLERDDASRAAATKGTAALLEALRSRRAALVAAAGKAATERAIHNAEILDQCARMLAVPLMGGSGIRDESMAANIAWLLEQNPGEKIVLWAHNGHVGRNPQAMGGFLTSRFPGQMVVVGFTTTKGRYTAVGDGGLTDHPLKPPGPATLEHRLSAHGAPIFILDVRGAKPDDPGSSWLTNRLGMRAIGAMAMDVQFQPIMVIDTYDLIAHIETTTPARQLGK
ncbi:MAG: erythromycin esterase family protein [Phycisphaerales bacterium]